MNDITRRAAGAAWWSTLEIMSRYGVQFLVTITLARLLTPADFGLIAMVLVFTSIGTLLVDSGFGTALIQRRRVTADDETTVFAFAFCSGLLIGLLLWMMAPLIAAFYREPRLIPLTHLVAWVLPLGGLSAVPEALLTKQLQFEKRARAEILASGVSGAVAILLAWKGFGVWSMAWQGVVAMAMRTACLWIFARWAPVGRFRAAAFRDLFSFGSFMLLAKLSDAVYNRAQALLLGRLFNAPTLGYYTLAQNAQQAPTNVMGMMLDRVGLPVFSEIADQPSKLREALRLSLRVSLFLFLPCMAGLSLIAEQAIILVYGPRWQSAAPVLTLLALASALQPLHVLNLAALTAQGRSDLLVKLELMKKAVALTLIVASSPLGPVAVAGAVLASSLYAVFVNTRYSSRMLEYGLIAQLTDQGSTLLLCATAAAAGWAVLHWTLPSMLHTLAAVAAAATVYVGGAFLLRSTALREFLDVMRSLTGSWRTRRVE